MSHEVHQRETGKYVGAVLCMDGKVQDSVASWLKARYGVTRVDRITAAGPSKVLSDNPNPVLVKHFRGMIEISVNGHKSPIIAVMGHNHCGGNPAGKDEQIKQLRSVKDLVESFNLGVEVIILWVEGEDESATVELIDQATHHKAA